MLGSWPAGHFPGKLDSGLTRLDQPCRCGRSVAVSQTRLGHPSTLGRVDPLYPASSPPALSAATPPTCFSNTTSTPSSTQKHISLTDRICFFLPGRASSPRVRFSAWHSQGYSSSTQSLLCSTSRRAHCPKMPRRACTGRASQRASLSCRLDTGVRSVDFTESSLSSRVTARGHFQTCLGDVTTEYSG